MLEACVLATLVGAGLMFSRLSLEAFNTPKLLVVVLGASLCAGVVAAAQLRGHPVRGARGIVWIAGAAFLVLGLLSALQSPLPWRSFAGASNARTGFALYAGCAVLGFAAALLGRRGRTDVIVRALLLTAVVVIAYGGVQAFDADPLRWRVRSGGPPVFSTFGNANFMSGWLGIVTVLAVWGAAARHWTRAWRWLGVGVAVVGMAVAIASGSIQGPIAALAGAAVLALAWMTDSGHHKARRRLTRSVAAAAIPVTAIAAGAALLAVRGGAADSFGTRVGKWQAALAIGADRPLTGVGFDLFGDWYHAYRPLSDAVSRGVKHTADSAHSVALQLLAGGGIPLLAAYLAVVVGVTVVLVTRLRHISGSRRLLLGGLGGAWIAYLVQATVSMDVPPLAALGWVLAGLIAGASDPDRAPHFPRCRHAPWSQGAALLASLCGAAVMLALAVPVRADVAARRAVSLTVAGRHAEAEEALRTALDLNPWEPGYAVQLGRLRAARGDHAQALEAYRLATLRQPRGIAQALETPRVAHSGGDHRMATAAYDYALSLDPKSPELLLEVARHHLRFGDRDAAPALLRRAAQAGGRSGRRAQLILDGLEG